MSDVQGCTIVVCEDDPAMTRIFQFLLRQQGIRNVFTAATGAEALAATRKHKPDLLLLDMMLPDRDGLSVLMDLKNDETTRAIPVIVVSGKEAQNQVSQAMAAGAIDYVIKPFEPMELGVRIKTFLSTIRSASGSEPTAGSPPAASGGAR